MFNDLDATLKALLADASAPADLRAADVSFDTPDKDYKPAQATVNLFLNEVTENRELRESVYVRDPVRVQHPSDKYTSRRPSLRVDCTYLTTTWSAQAGGLKAAEEHRLLGLALQWLSRFPLLDPSLLRGSLASPPQPFPVPAVVARTQEGRSNGDFWSALGIPPRPAFSVTVTVSVEPYDQVDTFAAARSIQVDGVLMSDPALAGRVLDDELAPVPAAVLTVVQTGAQATTSPEGKFAVPGLAFGDYTLKVEPAGRAAAEFPVRYAADHRLCTIVLDPP